MTPQIFVTTALAPALTLLPPEMDSPEARALVVAICLHESNLTARRQSGTGPARGYPQFEPVGVHGVLIHPRSATHLQALCVALDVLPTVAAIHRAMEFQDVLAAGLARLLLWTVLARLPFASQPEKAYAQYLDAWNPNRDKAALHEAAWRGNYRQAWSVIRGATT